MGKSIFVTGVAGCGKSALSAELQSRGVNSFDIEKVPGLFSMTHKETSKVADHYVGSDLNEMRQYNWLCDIDVLKKLIKMNKSADAYYCGIGSNIEEMVVLFDKTFLLVADNEETKKRLTNRTSNRFARTLETQLWVLTWKQDLEDKIMSLGAQVINANQPLAEVADEVIAKVATI